MESICCIVEGSIAKGPPAPTLGAAGFTVSGVGADCEVGLVLPLGMPGAGNPPPAPISPKELNIDAILTICWRRCGSDLLLREDRFLVRDDR
jgi:hypothetical protein